MAHLNLRRLVQNLVNSCRNKRETQGARRPGRKRTSKSRAWFLPRITRVLIHKIIWLDAFRSTLKQNKNNGTRRAKMASSKNVYDCMNMKGSNLVRLIQIGGCIMVDIESLYAASTRKECKTSGALQQLLSLTSANEAKQKTDHNWQTKLPNKLFGLEISSTANCCIPFIVGWTARKPTVGPRITFNKLIWKRCELNWKENYLSFLSRGIYLG